MSVSNQVSTRELLNLAAQVLARQLLRNSEMKDRPSGDVTEAASTENTPTEENYDAQES